MGKLEVTGWPEKLTPQLRSILGYMCFQLGPCAHIYQAAGEYVGADGQQLEKRAEDEQAFMLHKLIGFAIEYGDEWRDVAEQDMLRAQQVAIDRKAQADG